MHIDFRTMDEAEGAEVADVPSGGYGEHKLSKKEAATVLRDTVDTIGQRGEQI